MQKCRSASENRSGEAGSLAAQAVLEWMSEKVAYLEVVFKYMIPNMYPKRGFWVEDGVTETKCLRSGTNPFVVGLPRKIAP